jgi:proliferating cell nuclear antigen
VTFAAIVTADTLAEYLAPVDALVDECTIDLTPEGLHIAAVDPANVAMVEARLGAGAFESYEADGGRLGVDLDRLTDVLDFGDSGALVRLELDGTTRTLDIAVGALDYTLACIDPDAIREEPDLPALDLPGEVVLEGGQLATMADAAAMVSDRVTLGIDGGAVYAVGTGDTDDARIEYGRDDMVNLTEATVSSYHSLDYMIDCVGAVPDEAEVTVGLGDEQPTQWRYPLNEGYADVEVIIAPRVAGGDG